MSSRSVQKRNYNEKSKSSKKSSKILTNFREFMSIQLHELRKEHPGLANTEYMRIAAKLWDKYKKEHGIVVGSKSRNEKPKKQYKHHKKYYETRQYMSRVDTTEDPYLNDTRETDELDGWTEESGLGNETRSYVPTKYKENYRSKSKSNKRPSGSKSNKRSSGSKSSKISSGSKSKSNKRSFGSKFSRRSSR